MGYNQKAKFIKNSPLPCWKGYERVPGTARGAKGSCRKSSPAKLDLTKKSGFGPRAAKGDDDQSKELAISKYEMGKYKKSPAKKQKGGGTSKTCLPAAKIRGLSSKKKKQLVSAKKSSGAQGKYKRSSKTNVKGARPKGATLRDWFQKEDWRRVDDPSKKCGE